MLDLARLASFVAAAGTRSLTAAIRVRLGASEDAVLSGLPPVLRRSTNDHSRVELELTVGLSRPLRPRLDAGDLDLEFLKRRPGGRIMALPS